MSEMPSEPLLRVDNIHTYYGKSHILHGVSLEVGQAEVVGLLGRNGVGKSTTLKAVAGLVHPARSRSKAGASRNCPRIGWPGSESAMFRRTDGSSGC
jgi:ABC-type Mn2+/Zn2+ transport system ATPase subunit